MIELHKKIIKILTLKVSLEFLARLDCIWYLDRSLDIPGKCILTENRRMVSKEYNVRKIHPFCKRLQTLHYESVFILSIISNTIL